MKFQKSFNSKQEVLEDDVPVIKLSEMTINGVVNEKLSPVQQKDEITEKSIDLISMTRERDDDDNISFDEGRLQEWNFLEFWMQLVGSLSALILLFGCGLISAWSITDFIKDSLSTVNLSAKNESSIEDDWLEIDGEFYTSRQFSIGMVVLSWNVGAVIGGIIGAYVVPRLPNRIIYALCSVLLFLSGFALTKHSTLFFCVKGRLTTGLVYGIVQLTIIVEAAESTTKKVRRWMLVVATYTSALAYTVSILLFHFYDHRIRITYSEEVEAIYIISYAVMGLSLLALAANYFTNDTVPFLLTRGAEKEAFEEIIRLKSNHLSRLDIRYEYERIRLDIAQEQLDGNRGLTARINLIPLAAMCCIRLLNLLFNNIPMTLFLINPQPYENEDTNSVNATSSPDNEIEEQSSPLLCLVTLHSIRMFCSVGFLLHRQKYHFNRMCYKLGFTCGAGLMFWFFIVVFFHSIQLIVKFFFYPVVIIFLIGFTGLPIPLEIIQLCQAADSHARIRNTWSLAFAIFIENLFHMILILLIDMLFGLTFVFWFNGASMMYFSNWLLKNMPNVVAIYPLSYAIQQYQIKRMANEHSVHI